MVRCPCLSWGIFVLSATYRPPMDQPTEFVHSPSLTFKWLRLTDKCFVVAAFISKLTGKFEPEKPFLCLNDLPAPMMIEIVSYLHFELKSLDNSNHVDFFLS